MFAMCQLCRPTLYMANCQEEKSAKNPTNAKVPDLVRMCCWVAVYVKATLQRFVPAYGHS